MAGNAFPLRTIFREIADAVRQCPAGDFVVTKTVNESNFPGFGLPSLLVIKGQDGYLQQLGMPITDEEVRVLVAAGRAHQPGGGAAGQLRASCFNARSGEVLVGGKGWEQCVTSIANEAALGLGVQQPVTAKFTAMTVCVPGSPRIEIDNNSNELSYIGPLLIVLPFFHKGGDVTPNLGIRDRVVKTDDLRGRQLIFIAASQSTEWDMSPVQAGHRISLTYDLHTVVGVARAPTEAYYGAMEDIVSDLQQNVQDWGVMESDGVVPSNTPLLLAFGDISGNTPLTSRSKLQAVKELDEVAQGVLGLYFAEVYVRLGPAGQTPHVQLKAVTSIQGTSVPPMVELPVTVDNMPEHGEITQAMQFMGLNTSLVKCIMLLL